MSKSSLPKDAQKAFAEGRRLFLCRINQGAFQTSFSTPLYGIAEVIEGIEAAGWVLDRMSWSQDHRDHPSAFCLFRRPVMPQPPMPPMPQQQYGQPPMPPGAQPGFPPPPQPPTTTSWGRRG